VTGKRGAGEEEELSVIDSGDIKNAQDKHIPSYWGRVIVGLPG